MPLQALPVGSSIAWVQRCVLYWGSSAGDRKRELLAAACDWLCRARISCSAQGCKQLRCLPSRALRPHPCWQGSSVVGRLQQVEQALEEERRRRAGDLATASQVLHFYVSWSHICRAAVGKPYVQALQLISGTLCLQSVALCLCLTCASCNSQCPLW